MKPDTFAVTIGVQESPNCPICHQGTLQEFPDYFALTRIRKEGTSISFLPANGMPIVVYACPVCKFLQLQPARAARPQEW